MDRKRTGNGTPPQFPFALSLLLCIAAVALWVRSYTYDTTLLQPAGNGRSVGIETLLGRLSIGIGTIRPSRFDSKLQWTVRLNSSELISRRASVSPMDLDPCSGLYYDSELDRSIAYDPKWVFGCIHRYDASLLDYGESRIYYPFPEMSLRGRRIDGRFVVMPLALPASGTLIFPLLWVFRRMRNARRPAGGLCRKCGYDLRATRVRCPECGTPTEVRRA